MVPAHASAEEETSAASYRLARNLPYAEPANPRQTLDVYSPKQGANHPVVVWIHGGGWQTGSKESVQHKPAAFTGKNFVFVSINYRLLPHVDMSTIVRDVAKAIRWVHDHAAEHGGDPNHMFIMGHSAGAQLAALICTDAKYLGNEGLSFAGIKGCVPVDGDTYDIPLQITTASTRRNHLGQPEPKYGHFQKFGSSPELHRHFSAVTHVARGKGIPPFLILHVADHADTTAQAKRLEHTLQQAEVPATAFAAPATNHIKINSDLGLPDDPATFALWQFVEKSLQQ